MVMLDVYEPGGPGGKSTLSTPPTPRKRDVLLLLSWRSTLLQPRKRATCDMCAVVARGSGVGWRWRMAPPPFIRTADELNAEWLSLALDRPALEVLGIERIG